MVSVDMEGLPYALLNVNCTNNTVMENDGSRPKRTNIAVKCSFDDGQTFEKELEISSYDKGGYCDIAVDSKGKAYVIWEEHYGTNVHLTTFSFVDEFCKDEYVMNKDTAIVFNSKEKLSLITDYKNMSGELKDGALRIVTESKTTSKSMVVDYSTVTRSIDASEYKYLLCRIKVDPSTAGNSLLEGYVRSGRTTSTNTELGAKVTVPNDGEWHNVIVDFSDKDIDGTLQNIQLRFSVENGAKAEIVTADIAGIAMFKTEADAQGYQFDIPEDDGQSGNGATDTADTSDTAETTGTDTNEENESGCGSSVGAVGVICACAAAGATAATVKGKKKKE
jgi:hypothetical protein